MRVVSQISVRVVAFAALCVMLNFVYEHVQLPHDLEKYCPQFERITLAIDADVVYFGDCSDVYCSKNCETDTAVSAFLKMKYPELNVVGLSENGYHPELYLEMMQTIAEHSDDPKTVIVTLNLRAFSDHIINDRYYDPFLRQQLQLTQKGPGLMNRACLTFRMNAPPAGDLLEARTSEIRITDSLQLLSGSITAAEWLDQFANNEIAQSYIEDYGFNFNDAQVQRLSLFGEMADLARANGWKLIIHHVPFDFEGIEERVGSDLSAHVSNLESIVLDYTRRLDVESYNHFRLLPNEMFLGNKSNSHYTTDGKKELATALEIK